MMPKQCFTKIFSRHIVLFVSILLQSLLTSSVAANEIEKPRLESDSSLSIGKSETANIQLNGGVSVFQPHSLIGKWNGRIKRFGTHPKLFITECHDGQIAGSYKGIFGTFPLTGQYEDATGNITIDVDFTSSKWTRLKRFRSGHGIIEANIQNGVLVGRASISDLGHKPVRWEAVKDLNVINAESTKHLP